MIVQTYFGTGNPRGPAYVAGHEFGPQLIAFGATPEDTLDEYDERFGERVTDVPADLDHALNSGEIRVNDGGTVVYASAYEWLREFDSGRAAVAWIRSLRPDPVTFAPDA